MCKYTLVNSCLCGVFVCLLGEYIPIALVVCDNVCIKVYITLCRPISLKNFEILDKNVWLLNTSTILRFFLLLLFSSFFQTELQVTTKGPEVSSFANELRLLAHMYCIV